MLLISRAGTSFCAFVGTTNVPGEEARSRAVCSFRDFKAHSSKDVAITILASSLCLGWPVLFKRRALLVWGQLKHIPWSAVFQKICPSWPVFCDYSLNEE